MNKDQTSRESRIAHGEYINHMIQIKWDECSAIAGQD